MKKLWLSSMLVVLAFSFNQAATLTQEQFTDTLKSQQQSISKNCKEQLNKANPEADETTKKRINTYCSCVADNTSSNPTYVKKMYEVAKKAKSEKEYTKKIEAIGSEIGMMCEKKIRK